MGKAIMSEFKENLRVVFVAAWRDTIKNFFRPLHNAKVLFGRAKEEPIGDQIERARSDLRKKNQTTLSQ